jgi:hypothetical protein
MDILQEEAVINIDFGIRQGVERLDSSKAMKNVVI